MTSGFSQWSSPTNGQPGGAGNTYPIHGGPTPWFRDALDAIRSGRTPEASYPDGYLGTVRTRRQDRLVAHGGGTSTDSRTRSYERGVHVGSRVSPNAYFWNEDIHPQLGLELQSVGRKFAPTGEVIPHLTNDGKPGGPAAEAVYQASWVPRARSV